MHHVEGRRVRARRQDVTLEAEPGRGERQHAAELTAAQNADGGLRFERGAAHALVSFGASATASVWRARHASSRPLNAGSLSAKTLAARSAALTAPAWPMASVPTGTPGGICTIE